MKGNDLFQNEWGPLHQIHAIQGVPGLRVRLGVVLEDVDEADGDLLGHELEERPVEAADDVVEDVDHDVGVQVHPWVDPGPLERSGREILLVDVYLLALFLAEVVLLRVGEGQ